MCQSQGLISEAQVMQSVAVKVHKIQLWFQFGKWVPSSHYGNASISLEFKTSRPDGIILYTDDGGYTDFVEIKVRIVT